MEITIKNKKYTLKYGFRVLFAFESMAMASFDPQKLVHEIILFYASLTVSNADFSMGFDEFIDFMDQHPDVLVKMRKWLLEELKKQAVLLSGGKDEKKKSTRRPRTIFQDADV